MDARNRASIPALGIEAIVDLAGEETPVEVSRDLIYCRLPLVDGSGNCPARIDLAIETIRQLITARVPTLVACSAGLSRSPLLTAAALARSHNGSLKDTLKAVVSEAPSDVSPALLLDVSRQIDEPV